MINWIKEHVLLTIGIVIGLIGATVGGIEFSSSTIFCSNACHIMDPEAKTFAASHHAIIGEKIGGHGIGCKSCHYGPGIQGILSAKIGAMLHEMPNTILSKEGIEWEEFEEEMKEQGYGEDQAKWPKQYIHTLGNRKFGVKPHGQKLDDTNFNCRRCHTPIADYINNNGLLSEKTASKKEHKSVVDAHIHLPSKAWDDKLAMTVSKINSDHPGHQDRGLYCTDCHMEVAHGYNPPYNLPTMERCFRCHNGKKAFRDDCARCHVTQKNMHKGVGGIGVTDSQSYMNDQVSCVECHPEENNYKQSREACVGCHNDSYKAMVVDWQNNIKSLINNLNPIFNEVDKKIKEAEEKQVSSDKAQTLFDDAKRNYDYVIADGSYGGHNVDYAESLLDISKKKLEMAKEALKH